MGIQPKKNKTMGIDGKPKFPYQMEDVEDVFPVCIVTRIQCVIAIGKSHTTAENFLLLKQNIEYNILYYILHWRKVFLLKFIWKLKLFSYLYCTYNILPELTWCILNLRLIYLQVLTQFQINPNFQLHENFFILYILNLHLDVQHESNKTYKPFKMIILLRVYASFFFSYSILGRGGGRRKDLNTFSFLQSHLKIAFVCEQALR